MKYRIARDWNGEQTFAEVVPSEMFPGTFDGLNIRQAVPNEVATTFDSVSDAVVRLIREAIIRSENFGTGDAWRQATRWPFYIVDEQGQRV